MKKKNKCAKYVSLLSLSLLLVLAVVISYFQIPMTAKASWEIGSTKEAVITEYFDDSAWSFAAEDGLGYDACFTDAVPKISVDGEIAYSTDVHKMSSEIGIGGGRAFHIQ